MFRHYRVSSSGSSYSLLHQVIQVFQMRGTDYWLHEDDTVVSKRVGT